MAPVKPPQPIVIGDLRGGRNDTDPPMSLPQNQCVEALNVDWKDATVARKRGGSAAVTETGGTAFSSGIQSIFRHVPGAAETAAEFWGIDGAATPIVKRMTGGTSFADVTLDDAIATVPKDVVAVTLNGKLFLAYDSTQDRLHVYDPSLAAPRVRRVGLAAPAAPTVANTGAGAYAAVLRYYRARWLQWSSPLVIRRSEAGPSVSFTPSGAGAAARITLPALPGEGETHWELEVSSDNSTWFLLAGVGVGITGTNNVNPVATTTYDDDRVASAYPTGRGPDQAGLYKLFPSVKYLLSDGNRILGAGAWEAAGANSDGKNSRIWFTPVLGSADKGEDERLVNTTTQKNWVDLNENDGGFITGLGGPLNGLIFAFKYRQVWKLTPTGDVSVPYLPKKLRDDIGCISHKSIRIGEDEAGNACLYFMSHRGPYRISQSGGVQYLGRDNEVTWRSMNLAATGVVTHSEFYPDLHQWWVWIATGAANDPDVKMMLDVQRGFPDENGQIRGGWAKHTGSTAVARCSVLFSNTLGATMSRDLKPYIGRASGTAIQKCDTTDTDDAGTDFQAYVTTRPLLTTPDLLRKVKILESRIVGKATAGSDVTVTINRDFGLETRAHSVSLAPAASETRVVKKVEGSEMGEADVVQMTIGDSAANDEVWTVDALITPVVLQEMA